MSKCPFYVTANYLEYDCKFLTNKRRYGVELFYCEQEKIVKKYVEEGIKMLSCKKCGYLEEIE